VDCMVAETLIWLPCPTRQRRSCTTSPAGFAVANVLRHSAGAALEAKPAGALDASPTVGEANDGNPHRLGVYGRNWRALLAAYRRPPK